MTRFLYTAAYIFLCLPYVFFLSAWLRPPYSLAAVATLLWGTAMAIRGVYRDFDSGHGNNDTPLEAKALLTVLAPVVVVMLISGIGGWGYQTADYLLRNAVMLNLVNMPWPVVYQTETGPLVLVYYVASYLPAAWVGKIAGWEAANFALFFFSCFGLTLAALWVVKVARIHCWWSAIVFLSFSGMDVVGKLIRLGAETATNVPHQTWSSLEWWAGFGVAAFPAHLEMLVNTFNQAIPGWLISALVLHDARERRLSATSLFYLGVSTFWAPYVSVGLFLLVPVLVLPEVSRERRWAAMASWPNALGVLLGLTTAAYFSMRYWPYTLPLEVANFYQEHFTLTLFRAGPVFLGIYPLFVVLEFGLLHALLYVYLRYRRTTPLLDPSLWRSLVVSTVVLSTLPWINGSWNNDIVLRACLPMLFVTAVVVLRVLGDNTAAVTRRLHLIKLGILLVLAVGAFNAGWIFGRQVLDTYRQGELVAVPDPGQVLSPFELQRQRYNAYGFNQVGQYMGSYDSLFAKHLMAHPTPNAP